VPVDVAQVVNADLAGSGRFNTLASADLPSQPHRFAEIQFDDWRRLGMENLVIGTLAPTASGDYEIEFRVVDTFKATQLGGYQIVSPGDDLRLAAHHIADRIYELLTGEPGAFATRISYVTVTKDTRGKAVYQLQLADADGYNPKTLLESMDPILSPAWSPDGRKLAYVSFEGKSLTVYVQHIATGHREAVATGPGINSAPAWSPDGGRLALTLSKDGNPEIYVLTLAGRRLQRITDDPAIDTEPAWSPDGRRIAFTSDRGGTPQVYQVRATGGHPERITLGMGPYNARPSYSHDGRLMALVHGEGGRYRIAVLDLASRDLRVLTDSRLDESPSFAPNGTRIIYATVGSRGTELAAISVDGSVQQRLATSRGEVREPAWGPLRRW
jgi:TolB protein